MLFSVTHSCCRYPPLVEALISRKGCVPFGLLLLSWLPHFPRELELRRSWKSF
jgi:hypothetical protein